MTPRATRRAATRRTDLRRNEWRRQEHREPGWGAAIGGGLLGAMVGFATYWMGAVLLQAPVLAAMAPREIFANTLRPATVFTYWQAVIVTTGALVGAAVARYKWRLAGVLGIVGMLSLAGGYIAYAWWVTIPQVPPDQRWLSYLLLTAEACLLALVVSSAFYSLDVATRRRWDRLPKSHAFDPNLLPKTALMVPLFNEPPEMVEQTIAHLVRQDYPRDRLVVMVLDDSTDIAISREIAAAAQRLGARYIRRQGRNGFKAGAINHATRLLDPDVDLIGIIDADYWVSPAWLKSVVGHFVDDSIAFVQTPQDYRNADESFLTRQYQRAEAYFYHAMMPSRNEENAIIFCGTMGIIRRRALEEVGGFAEDQICEDAEISVRLVAAGWNSLYIDQGFGKGLMPATFDQYKKQFHRWAFGNVKILFTHWWTILRSKMRRRQKLDYIVSNLHWFDGFFIMIIAASLMYLGLAPLLGYEASTYHQNEVLLIALVPTLLLVDSFIRLHVVLRHAGHTRWRDALLVQGVWFAIKWTNLSAVMKAMLGRKAAFVRTPKDPGGRLGRTKSFFRAVWVTRMETLIATSLLGVALAHALRVESERIGETILPAWLAMYGLFFLCSPIYAYASYRTRRPMRYEGIALWGPDRVEFRDQPAA